MATVSRVMTALMVSFAAWTLAQNIAYFVGATPNTLPLLVVLVFAIGVLATRIAGTGYRAPWPTVAMDTEWAVTPWKDCGTFVSLVIPILALAVFFDIRFFACGLLATAVLLMRPITPGESAETPGPRVDNRALCVVALVVSVNVAVVSLLARFGDGDDFHYLAAAANVARNMSQPMADHYPILPYSDVPPPYPTFSVIAFHDLIGLLSYYAGCQPTQISSYFMAPIASVLIVLSYALCLRRLCPNVAHYALLFSVAFLVMDARHRGFGGFAFCRSWQGKSILLHVAFPMLVLQLCKYTASQHVRDAIFVSIAVTCCVGLSSVSLWIIPPWVIAFLIPNLVSAIRLGKYQFFWHCFLMLWHPIILVAWAYWGSLDAMSGRSELASYSGAVEDVLGPFFPAMVSLAIVSIGLFLLHEHSVRIRFGCVLFLFVSTFGNPLLTQLVASRLTSTVVYWRIWWFLPIGLLIGVGASGLLGLLKSRLRPIAAFALLALCHVVFGKSAIWERFEFADHPKLKMPERPLGELTNLKGKIPEPAYVLALRPHNQMIPTLNFDWYSVMPHEVFSRRCLVDRMGYQRLYDRHKAIERYLSGEGEFDEGLWEETLSLHPVNVVLHRSSLAGQLELSEFLEAREFSKTNVKGLVVWVHDEPVPEAPFKLKEFLTDIDLGHN